MKLQTLIPKSEARKTVLEKRKNITPAEVNLRTDKIIQRLAILDDFVYAKKIHLYISNRSGEVDTRRIINFALGWRKQIILPKFNKETRTFRRFQFTGWDELVKNQDGYLEPRMSADEDLSDIDLIFVPAVAISKLGQRVGQGGGHYDRLLRNTFAPKYVVAFEFQVFDNIETDIHDIRVDKIITELRTINTRDATRWS
ncbi:MAG: 5-formyltetrahydrofolate cyclo-ligase [Ignavibacteriales bacterium]